MEGFIEAVYDGYQKLNDDVYEFYLKVDDFDFEPGQFVTFMLKDDQGEFGRSYSIIDYRENQIIFCVKVLDEGRGSQALLKLKKGDVLPITSAKGIFQVQKTGQPKLFVANGVGIAPFIPMIQSIPDAKKTLILGCRYQTDLLYLDKLKKVPNLKLMISLTKPEKDWKGLTGRVTEILEKETVEPETEVYICGSADMIGDVIKHLNSIDHPKKHIFTEAFY
ncbi:MAG TPA: FAD-dependent oxidoreductase [Patescibacteria group bacterium]